MLMLVDCFVGLVLRWLSTGSCALLGFWLLICSGCVNRLFVILLIYFMFVGMVSLLMLVD